MRILFVHQNLPAQFRHLLGTLSEIPGIEVVGIREALPHPIVGFPAQCSLIKYERPQGGNPSTHHYLRGFEGQVRRGQAIVRVCLDLRQKGFIPDWIIAHPGWGESLFLKDVFPESRLIGFLEFFYRGRGGDVGFDPEYPAQLDDLFRLRIKNTHLLHDLAACDEALAPTQWQASQAPEIFHPKIRVMHDGIRTDLVCPNAAATFRLPNGKELTSNDSVLTYVARNLEPYRGFHVFMRALPEILKANPATQVVVVGGDEVSYGSPPKPPHKTYREKLMAEVGEHLDLSRVHFVGKLPYAHYLTLLQVSRLHIYLTYPFVLSWSLLEAMSAGCRILGSATPPVQEVIKEGETGYLCDFFDHHQLAARATVFLNGDDDVALRWRARQFVIENMDYQNCIRPRWLEWLGIHHATKIPNCQALDSRGN